MGNQFSMNLSSVFNPLWCQTSAVKQTESFCTVKKERKKIRDGTNKT